jgi:hypothetical protein
MKNKTSIEITLCVLWYMALGMGIVVFAYLFSQFINYNVPFDSLFFEKNSSILAAFFILLSAGIASASLMRSIESQKVLDDRKQKMDVADAISTLLITVVKTEKIEHSDLMVYVNKTRRAKFLFSDKKLHKYIGDIHDKATRLNQLHTRREESYPKINDLNAGFEDGKNKIVSKSLKFSSANTLSDAILNYQVKFNKRMSELNQPIEEYNREHPEIMKWFVEMNKKVEAHLSELVGHM